MVQPIIWNIRALYPYGFLPINAIARYCLLVKVDVHFLVSFGSLLSCQNEAPGKRFYLLPQLVVQVPDVGIKEAVVVFVHLRNVEGI